jgi:hypothetical protein
VPRLKSEIHRRRPIFLKDGTFGKVYKTDYTMRFSSTELAYKEYKDSAPSLRQRGETTRNSVVFRNSRSLNDLDLLNRYFAWPCELVMDDATSEICGFLMPLADAEFSWGNRSAKPTGWPRTWRPSPQLTAYF